LCSQNMGQVFATAIGLVQRCDSLTDLKEKLTDLYDSECRAGMEKQQNQLEFALRLLLGNHKKEDFKSWAVVALENAASSIRRRQRSPLSLIEPVYLGESLHELACEVGSPIVITNDMRITSLSAEQWTIMKNATRTISCLCDWIIEDGKGSFVCPYAGCPGCPPQRASTLCKTDARKVLTLPDDVPWCCLYFSAKQLRVVDVMTESLVEQK
jgi:hypothetical protein